MTAASQAELRDRIAEVTGRPALAEITIAEDTTNYMRLDAGTVVRLEGADYLVTGDATEGRFGIGDQPKFWVKYVVELDSGERKILKLVFQEEFTAAVGPFSVRCRRSPDKESRVLDLVRGDPRFMQGKTVRDLAGNNVRVLDFIKGHSLFRELAEPELGHERYFREAMPSVLERVLDCFEGLATVHRAGLQHGDVRNDHILIEAGTGRYRWIDFDFEVNFRDFDVWSAGNILSFVVGQGIRTCREAERASAARGERAVAGEADALVFFRHRLANVRKLYPYVPEGLNEILMRFSRSTTSFYEDLGEIVRDLRAVLESSPPP